MNVRKFTIVCLLSLLCACLEAQELRVKGMYEAPHDLAARTQARKDINGNYCALLKVQLVDRGAEFGGTVIGNVSFERNEYWVYMAQGSKRVKVFPQDYLPLEVTFADYGIDHLEGQTTYILTLLRGDLQQESPQQPRQIPTYPNRQESDNSKVYDVVEEMPQFPGGPSALFEYLAQNINYPVVAEENGVQGRVLVTMVIERNGSVSDVKVVKSVDPSLDAEAQRVVRSMPHWIPGRQNGSPVRVKYTVPVTFKLQDTSKSNSAWFVFGTQRELEYQGILSDNRLAENLSQRKDYFTKIDIRIDKEIKLYSPEAEVLSNHPLSSYTLTLDARRQYVLHISDPYLFWSRSKYLVIKVR